MKAIILTSQRSGSTFLHSCLDAHPQIKGYGELLRGGNLQPRKPLLRNRKLTKAYCYIRARAWNPERIMDTYFGRNEAPIVVFKAMYNHADNRRVRRYLAEHEEIRVIHLRRENLLKQYVSKVLMVKKRGERPWQPHTTYKIPVVSARISPRRAIDEMCRVRNSFMDFERLLSRHKRIEVVYERLFNGPTLSNEAWAAVSELLEIEPANATTDYIKINPNDLRPMVENYDELAAALAGTEFAKYLDDESVEAPSHG
ncbi:MAG: sulfotransferase [Woeseia sp.]